MMDVLTDHFRSPYHRGLVSGMDWRCSLTNPLCGDEITIALVEDESQPGRYSAYQEGRGCLVSQASPSLLCKEVDGWPLEKLKQLTENDLLDLFEFDLTPRRKKCALLAYSALQQLVHERQHS